MDDPDSRRLYATGELHGLYYARQVMRDFPERAARLVERQIALIEDRLTQKKEAS